MTKKKRVMRAFKLDEISLVDNPAQRGATVTLMKSAPRRMIVEDDDGTTVIEGEDAIAKFKAQLRVDQGLGLSFAEALALRKDDATEEIKPMTKTPPFGDAEIAAKAAELMKRDRRLTEPLAKQQATARLAVEHGVYDEMYVEELDSDELLAKRREEARQPVRLTKDGADAVAAFNKAVEDIAKRDKCSRPVAMRKARKEHAEAYEAYQEAC